MKRFELRSQIFIFSKVLSKPDLRITELRLSYKDFEEEEKEK